MRSANVGTGERSFDDDACVADVAQTLLCLQESNGTRALVMELVEGTVNATSPFFSPGQWIGFFADGKLKKVSVHGGEPVALCDAPINRSGAGSPDNTIIFAPTLFAGLMRVSAAGGAPQVFNTPDVKQGELSFRWPEILPGGKRLCL